MSLDYVKYHSFLRDHRLQKKNVENLIKNIINSNNPHLSKTRDLFSCKFSGRDGEKSKGKKFGFSSQFK